MPIIPVKNLPAIFKTNLTFKSRLLNLEAESKLPAMFDKFSAEHADYVKALDADMTKTRVQKELAVLKDAERRTMAILNQFDKEHSANLGTINTLKAIIEDRYKIQGTTDLLILQSQAQVLATMKFTEVMGLLESGDIESLRALQLPIMKHHFKLVDPKRAEIVDSFKAKTLLTPEQLKTMEQSQAVIDTLQTMSKELVNQSVSAHSRIKQIESTIVAEPEVAE